MRGWNTPIADVREWNRLPLLARDYVKTIEQLIGVPIKAIGTGPARDAIIRL
jgi:adenylosuccinate synthase